MDDIFLSYSEKDRKTAAQIAALLESSGWSVWWDREIPAGKTWRDTIEDALQNMRCMVVLWSGHSIKSDWVREEADEGKSQHKLIPVLIEGVKPPVGFREIQAADLIFWDGSRDFPGFRQLIGDLESRLGKPTLTVEKKIAAAEPPINLQSSSGTPPGHETRTGGTTNEFFASVRLATLWRPLFALALLIIIGIVGFKLMHSSRDSFSTEPVGYSQAKHPEKKETRNASAAAVIDTPSTALGKLPAHSEKRKLSAASEPGALTQHPKTNALFPAGSREATGARVSQRCNDLLMRVQIGEPLSGEDHAWFEKECK